MEEMRTIAKALYKNGSSESQAAVMDFFKKLDTDGNGSISRAEFMGSLVPNCPDAYKDSRFFSHLDEDGNGSLDFMEVITFSYHANFRGVICDGCQKIPFGLYFTCVCCFQDKSCKNTFDLCLNCFQSKNHNHKHTEFLDNYAMLIATKRAASTETGSSTTMKAWELVKTFNTGHSFASAMAGAGLCTIM